MRDSFSMLASAFRDISRYRDLFMYLLAYLIYIDGADTIIGTAGIPASLIFGRLPDPRM